MEAFAAIMQLNAKRSVIYCDISAPLAARFSFLDDFARIDALV
jgi:hypothetical protein